MLEVRRTHRQHETAEIQQAESDAADPAFEQEREEPERHHVEDEVHQVPMHEAVRDDRVIDAPALRVVRPENEAIHQLRRGIERHEAHDDRRGENQQCDAHGQDDLSRG